MLPALAKALTTSSPSTVTALRESVPITAVFGPYTPDLEGTLRTFGQATAYYDANGHYVRISPTFPDFKLGENNNLTPAANAGQALKASRRASCAAAQAPPPSPPPTALSRSPMENC